MFHYVQGAITNDFHSYTLCIGTLSFHIPEVNVTTQHTALLVSDQSQKSFFVPPGTHHCWVRRDIVQ